MGGSPGRGATGPGDPDRLLGALLRRARRQALVPVAKLACDCAKTQSWVLGGVATLVEAGLAECWSGEDDGGPYLVLSALAAARQGLELAESGLAWQPAGGRRRKQRVGGRRTRLVTEADRPNEDLDDTRGAPVPRPEDLADDSERSDPARLAEAAEERRLIGRSEGDDAGLPRPRRLLGQSATWPLPGQDRPGRDWFEAQRAAHTRQVVRAERSAALLASGDDSLRPPVVAQMSSPQQTSRSISMMERPASWWPSVAIER